MVPGIELYLAGVCAGKVSKLECLGCAANYYSVLFVCFNISKIYET